MKLWINKNPTIAGKLLISTWLYNGLIILSLLIIFSVAYIFTQHQKNLTTLHVQQNILQNLDNLITGNALQLHTILDTGEVESIPLLLAKNEDLHGQYTKYQDIVLMTNNLNDESFSQEFEGIIFSLRSSVVNTIVLARQERRLEANHFFERNVLNQVAALKSIIEKNLYTKNLEIKLAEETIRNEQNIYLAITATIFLILITFITMGNLKLIHSIKDPLSELIKFTKQISQGNLTTMAKVESHDELGWLADALNTMSAKLEQAFTALRENNIEMERKNAELERFTYTVSHDLKSPLITIRGFTGYLEKDLADGNLERVTQNLDQIKQATDHMQHLLDDLLELSRIGHVLNSTEEIDLNKIVKEVQSHISGQIRECDTQIIIKNPLPTVIGNPIRIREVMQNLLVNAIKFVKPNTQPHIEIIGLKNNQETGCCIKDNGIGIDSRYQKTIFGLFERLNNEKNGTGIGLAITKRIVDLHGGRIWVESEGLGHGSSFCFMLPLSSPTANINQNTSA